MHRMALPGGNAALKNHGCERFYVTCGATMEAANAPCQASLCNCAPGSHSFLKPPSWRVLRSGMEHVHVDPRPKPTPSRSGGLMHEAYVLSHLGYNVYAYLPRAPESFYQWPRGLYLTWTGPCASIYYRPSIQTMGSLER